LLVEASSSEKIMNGFLIHRQVITKISRSHPIHSLWNQQHLAEGWKMDPQQLPPLPASQLVPFLLLPSLYILGTITGEKVCV